MTDSNKLIFTEYVDSLNPGSQPDNTMFDRVWTTLRGALYAEMKRRSLHKVAPSCFGLAGYKSWQEDAAFDELVCDCYSFIFVERLPALKAQLQVKVNIEGLVFRNIQNFLHDMQKKHDPIGYRAYQLTRRAVELRVEGGTLFVISGGCRFGADTVLGFSSALSPCSASNSKASETVLSPLVRMWADALAVDMVTARGPGRREEVAHALASRLPDLAAAGVLSFRFKDLVSLIKAAVRARWHALGGMLEGETALEKEGDEGFRRVRIIWPSKRVEDRDSLDKLNAHVFRKIRQQSPRFRREAGRFWTFLKCQAVESRVPSRRQIAKRLGFTRHQVAKHFKSLRSWVDQFKAVV